MGLERLWGGGGWAVVIPVIMEIYTDRQDLFQTPVMTLTLTRRNQMQDKTNRNKQTTDGSFSLYSHLT